MSKEAMKLALEAAYLAGFNASGEGYNGEYPFGDHARNPEEDAAWIKDRDNALREALAEQPAQQQEPVAFEIRAFNATQALIKRADVAQEKADVLERGFGGEADVTIVPLYPSPPASKPWVGLTDDEILYCVELENPKAIAEEVEAKLKEKNA